jgi:hypothetical protein
LEAKNFRLSRSKTEYMKYEITNLLFRFGFFTPFVFPLYFRSCFVPVFLAPVVSSLAYPNLLGTKRLGCCCNDSPDVPVIMNKGYPCNILVIRK